MYHVTELIAKFDKTNHKKIISSTVDRKNRSFETLRGLAHFTREHTIFTSYQKEISGVPRTNEAGRELYLGNNLLWLDLDFTVNLVELKKKLLNLNISCFAYYSSSYYTNAKAHARLCIICEEQLDIDNWDQILFFANQILNKLELKQVETLDKSIYNLSSYLAMVKGVYSDTDLIVVKGKPFKWIKQEEFIKKYNSISNEKEKAKTVDNSGFGKVGEIASFLNTLDSVELALARNKGTISLAFTNIPEKTKLGYYINYTDPWFVYHPKKEFKYLSNLLPKKDFDSFKKFYLNFENVIPDPFYDDIEADKLIYEAFIDSKIFNKKPLIFLESPTGSGKTTAVSNWIKDNPEKSILFISVNRMQAIANYRSLKKKGIGTTCYLKHSLKEYQLAKKGRKKVSIYNETFENDASNYNLPHRLICGILSLHHLMKNGELLKQYDCVIIDEISTLPNNVSRSVKLIHERIVSFESGMKAFKQLLLKSEKVICLDGFLSNSVIDLITDLSEKEPFIIKNTLPTNKKVEIYVCSGNQPKFEGRGTCKKYLEKIMQDISEASFGVTKRLMVVALSSLDMSNDLGDLLRKKYPDKIIQVFNSELTEKDGMLAIQMFEDLDSYMEEFKIDILVYSPTITTGIDIPQTKGTNVYQIISGDQLASHTNYQMTMRGRNASLYRILIARSLMIDKQAKTFKDYMISSINEIKASIPFKSPKSIEWKSKSFQTSGLFLAYYILEYNVSVKKWSKVTDLKSLIETLKNVSKKYFYDLEGVKVALKIDKAYINFQKELYLKGKTGYTQYLNFLKHEYCRVTIEEDIYRDPHVSEEKYDSKKYKENYIEDYSNKLKNLGLWKEEYSRLKYRQLFEILKIAKAFNILREKIKIGKYTNEELIELYDTLYKKSFLREYKEFREFLNKTTDREKIAIIKSIFSIIFKVNTDEKYSIIIKQICIE